MQRYQDVVIDSNGQPVPSATVLVRPVGSTNTATIYSTNTGTSTRANPVTADSSGRFWFYGTNGRYDLVVSGSYVTTTTAADVMLEDVPLTNLAELTTASAARTNLGVVQPQVTSTSSMLVTLNLLSELSTSTFPASARANIGAACSTASQTLTGGQRFAVTTLASTGQITPDLGANNNFELSMTVNTTLAAGTAAVKGQAGRIVIFQNSTAKTLAYASTFWKFASTATLSTATVAGTADVIDYYIVSSTSAACRIINGV